MKSKPKARRYLIEGRWLWPKQAWDSYVGFDGDTPEKFMASYGTETIRDAIGSHVYGIEPDERVCDDYTDCARLVRALLLYVKRLGI